MDYYLIDKQKVRLYFENLILSGSPDANAESFTLKNVIYAFKNLKLVAVNPISDDAYAITTKGFIEWKNQSMDVPPNRRPMRFQIETGFGIFRRLSYVFCSGYICTQLPSKDTIKMTKDNLVLINRDKETNVYSIDDLEVKENNNELVLIRTEHSFNMYYYLGVEQSDKIYVFDFMSIDIEIGYKRILTRGTCIKTKHVLVKGELVPKEEKTYKEFCY